MDHFENYHSLTTGKEWRCLNYFEDLNKKEADRINLIKKANIEENIRQSIDDRMFTDACIHLQRIYRIISNKFAKNQEEKIDYLIKSSQVCKSSKNSFFLCFIKIKTCIE